MRVRDAHKRAQCPHVVPYEDYIRERVKLSIWASAWMDSCSRRSSALLAQAWDLSLSNRPRVTRDCFRTGTDHEHELHTARRTKIRASSSTEVSLRPSSLAPKPRWAELAVTGTAEPRELLHARYAPTTDAVCVSAGWPGWWPWRPG